jgi:hypothetical protein
MTLTDAIHSIIKSYKTLLTHASGATSHFEADRVTGSKACTRAPRDFGDEAEELLQRVVRLARVSEAQKLGALSGRLNHGTDRHHPVKRVTRTVILEEVGKDSAELAFLYGVHQDSVERIRREAGKDPKTGEPRAVTPLTEPPTETLRRRRQEASS